MIAGAKSKAINLLAILENPSCKGKLRWQVAGESFQYGRQYQALEAVAQYPIIAGLPSTRPGKRWTPHSIIRRAAGCDAHAAILVAEIHFVFKVPINSTRLWRMVFCLTARKPRTRAAPSWVAKNERIALSDSSPSFGAEIFFPTVGAPSKK